MKLPIHIVSASAGSGKTTRLAEELSRAVLEQGIAPSHIVATTFTRKAAAELITRGRRALLAAGRAREAELFRAARIGTVNAVAGMLVSELAFEAGIAPDLIVLDEARAEEAFRRSLSQVVTRADLDAIAALSSRFEELPWERVVQQIADAARTNTIDERALEAAARSSERSFSSLLDPTDEPAEQLDARLAGALEETAAALRARIAAAADRTKVTRDALRACEAALQSLELHGAIAWPEWARLMGLEAAVKSDALCEGVRRAASALLSHPRLHEDGAAAIRLLFDLARRALAAYRRYKLERRAIDFIDQETIALELLRRPDVGEILSRDIELVLVDEFQDTSPLQLALFLALARIAPRSLWVGDQKQSIYGFRGADPALMDAVIRELLGDAEPETLGIGRRSRAPLVDLTNALFVPPFGALGMPGTRVALSPAIAEDPLLGPVVERWIVESRSAAGAADRLAACVRLLLDDPDVAVRDRQSGEARRARPEDVAVLCRRRDTCLVVASALAVVGVTSNVARDGLLATVEGRAAMAGLALWIEPDDVLARAEIARLVEPDSVSIDALFGGEEADRLRDLAAVARLRSAREAAPHAGAVEALDAVVASLRLDEVAARWGRGRQGIANLDALRARAVLFARLARHHGGAASPDALLAHLRSLGEEGQDAQAIVGDSDAVQIATWHGAKGLEWPIVVLYELDASAPEHLLGVHVDQAHDGLPRLAAPLEGRAIRFWPAPFASRTPPVFRQRLAAHALSASVVEAEDREALRLLYVGWTRARDRVVLAHRGALGTGALALFARGGGRGLTEPPTPEPPAEVAYFEAEWAGQTVAVAVRRPLPGAARAAPPAPPITVLAVPSSLPSYPPARLRPSAVREPGRILAVDRLSAPLAVAAGADRLALGSAMHAFFAADRPDLDDDDRRDLARRLLLGWDIEHALAIDDLLACSARFTQWVARRWPGARVRRELPIERRLPEGTVVRGIVDVVIETPSEIAVIDHKAIVAPEPVALAESAAYAGQLALYAAAIAAAHEPRPAPPSTLIHLPLSGLVVTIAPA